MKPQFSITANGQVISDRIAPLLLSLTVTDETGEQSDRLSIRLDDVAGTLEMPRKGALIGVSLGLGSLVEIGTFVVDSVQASGPPNILQIDGHAAPFSGEGDQAALQARKSRSFDGKTVGDIAKSIAGEHGLDPKIDPDLAGIDLGHVDQTDERDGSFLNRLAREVGGAVKITTGKLAFIRRGGSRTASGQSMPSVPVSRDTVSRWSYVAADKGGFKSAIASYRALGAASTTDIVVGEGEPSLRLPHVYSNASNARRAAQARLDDAKRSSGGKLQAEMSGRLDLLAESPISATGFRQGVDGGFVIRRVEHTLDRSGLRTRIEAEAKPA